MNPTPPSKDDVIRMLIKKTLNQYVTENGLVKSGQRISYGGLFSIQADDLKTYFERESFPPLNNYSENAADASDFETVWTHEDGVYRAVWLERGTTTTVFSSPTREEFQIKWNSHLLEEYTRQMSYPWTF